MGRWAPDARERLESAALELFVENGYEATTVAQIAERAGLNRATFFRHFADKREVILAGEDALADRFADSIRAAAPNATLTECLHAALAAAGEVLTPARRAISARRIQVVAGNSELQERGELKFARVANSITVALRARGTDELAARLAGQIGVLAFRVAFEKWMSAPEKTSFASLAKKTLDDLQSHTAEFHVP